MEETRRPIKGGKEDRGGALTSNKPTRSRGKPSLLVGSRESLLGLMQERSQGQRGRGGQFDASSLLHLSQSSSSRVRPPPDLAEEKDSPKNAIFTKQLGRFLGRCLTTIFDNSSTNSSVFGGSSNDELDFLTSLLSGLVPPPPPPLLNVGAPQT